MVLVVCARQFTDHHHVAVLLQHLLVDFAKEFMHSRSIAENVAGRLMVVVRIGDRCVFEFALAVHIDRIHSESINTLFKPELNGGVVDGLTGDGILPIKVGLLGTEKMEVVFLCLLVPGPCESVSQSFAVLALCLAQHTGLL